MGISKTQTSKYLIALFASAALFVTTAEARTTDAEPEPPVQKGETSEFKSNCWSLWPSDDCHNSTDYLSPKQPKEPIEQLPPTTDRTRYRGKAAEKTDVPSTVTYFGIGYGGGLNFDQDDVKYRKGFRSLYEMVSQPVVLAVQTITNERTLAGVTAGYVASFVLLPYGVLEFALEGGLASLTHFGKLFGAVPGKIENAAVQFLGSTRLTTRWSLGKKYQFFAGMGFLVNGDPKYGRFNSKGYFSYYAGLSRRF